MRVIVDGRAAPLKASLNHCERPCRKVRVPENMSSFKRFNIGYTSQSRFILLFEVGTPATLSSSRCHLLNCKIIYAISTTEDVWDLHREVRTFSMTLKGETEVCGTLSKPDGFMRCLKVVGRSFDLNHRTIAAHEYQRSIKGTTLHRSSNLLRYYLVERHRIMIETIDLDKISTSTVVRSGLNIRMYRFSKSSSRPRWEREPRMSWIDFCGREPQHCHRSKLASNKSVDSQYPWVTSTA